MKVLVKNMVTGMVVGVGAGALDSALEVADARADIPRTEPFKTWADWSRVGLAAAGYLGQMFNVFPAITEPLAQSEITLVTKSIYNAVMSKSSAPVVVRGRTVSSPSPSGPSGRKVGWRPLAIGV